ncbi:MAG TPA: hypothetical protein VK179_10895 [Bacteroidales bacterium]|nr:hypothetical protein [Bacteroidales bacterium]
MKTIVSFALVIIKASIFYLLITSCNKDDVNLDWHLTSHRKLFDTTDHVSLNHDVNFTFLDDTTFFLYGKNRVTNFYRTYLVWPDSIIELTDSFHVFINEICLTEQNIFFRSNYNIYKSDRLINKLQLIISDELESYEKMHFIDKDTGIIYKSGYSEFLITNDGGENWSNSSLTSLERFYIFFALGDDKRICFLTSLDKVYISRDGGINWNFYFATDFKISKLFFVNENEGYLVAENKVYKTKDGGATINQIFAADFHVDKIQARNNEVYVLSSWALFYSEDDFENFRIMTLENPVPENMDRCVINFEIRDKRSYLVDNMGNVYYRDN